MRELGLAAGYENDYQLDQYINYWDAEYLFSKITGETYHFPEVTIKALLQEAALSENSLGDEFRSSEPEEGRPHLAIISNWCFAIFG